MRLGSRIVVVGGREDIPLIERFRALTSADPVIAAGRLSVQATAALLARCRAFVGNDSGPAHLAAAVGVPSVVLFSGTNDVAIWRPWGQGAMTIQEHPPCAPCGLAVCARADHACMTWITVDRVLEAVIAATVASKRTVASASAASIGKNTAG